MLNRKELSRVHTSTKPTSVQFDILQLHLHSPCGAYTLQRRHFAYVDKTKYVSYILTELRISAINSTKL